MPFYLEGVQAVMNQLNDLLKQMGDLTEDGMEDITEDIGGRAVLKAPIKDGGLRGSMETEVFKEGDTVVGEVRFTEKYAARQHEHVEYAHPQGGEAKYLEKAALEKADQIREQIAAILSDPLGGL